MSRTPRSRLPGLLLLLAAIVGIRWWDPLSTTPPPPDTRAAGALPAAVRQNNAQPAPPPTTDFFRGTREREEGEIHDLFAVKTAAAATPDPSTLEEPSSPTPQEPPPPPPAVEAAAPPAASIDLQVIGTWKDDAGFQVFVASARGVAIARQGDLLGGRYTVLSVGPKELRLRQEPGGAEVVLPVASAGPGLPLIPTRSP